MPRRSIDASGTASRRAFRSPAGAIVGLARMVEVAVDDCGLSFAKYRILALCGLEPTSPSELATWLAVQQQNLTRQIDSLVDQGLLARRMNSDDRRRIVLTVTGSGRALLGKADRSIEAYLNALYHRLSPTEARRMKEGLTLTGVAITRAWDRARLPGRAEPRGRLHRRRADQ